MDTDLLPASQPPLVPLNPTFGIPFNRRLLVLESDGQRAVFMESTAIHVYDALASGYVHAHNPWGSPAKGEAPGRVLYQQLHLALTPREYALMALLLLGYQHKMAGALLGLTKQQVFRTHQALGRKAVAVLGLLPERDRAAPTGSKRQAAARKAARARWARRPAFSVPGDVRALMARLTKPRDS